MKHLGDITKISGYTVPTVDCIIGGSPCQDLSVAGKRAGLVGERSGLFMEQIRIIKEMRERERRDGRTGVDIRPRYMVWENVPGAFSSNNGEDFRIVLEETARVADANAVIPRPEGGKWTTAGCIMADGWSIAWRVLDAQFWGVPQRRRRIALVADFGGQSAPEILFVRKSVSGDSEPRTEERKDDSSYAEGSIGESYPRPSISFQNREVYTVDIGGGKSCCGILDNKSPTLCTTHQGEPAVVYDARGNGDGRTAPTITGDHQNRITDYTGVVLTYRKQAHPRNSEEGQGYEETDKTDTLNVFDHSEARTPTIVVEMDRASYNQGKNAMFDIGISEDGVAHTLVAKGPGAVAYCKGINGDKTGTIDTSYYKGCGMRSGKERDVVCCSVDCRNGIEGDINGTLQSGASRSLNCNNVILENYVVRRLTPIECERLQGFPDGWTDIGAWTDSKGKVHKESTDSARYRAIGNSISLPPWKFVLKKICACYERDATMASLFDGIGGFPLIWERLNGKGSCLWASEIEEFPIAVTKERFGD